MIKSIKSFSSALVNALVNIQDEYFKSSVNDGFGNINCKRGVEALLLKSGVINKHKKCEIGISLYKSNALMAM